MSIVAQLTETIYFPAAEAVGPFSTVWFYEQADDVEVRLSTGGEFVLLESGTDYVLTGLTPLVSGGTVLLSDDLVPAGGWPDTARLSLRRGTSVDQPSVYGEGMGFSPLASEQALDHVAREVQDLATEMGRTIQTPAGDPQIVLPAAATRANQLFGFDGDGGMVPVSIAASGEVSVLIDQAGVTLSIGWDFVIRSSIAALTVNLPALADVTEGQGLWIWDGDHNAGVNNITVQPQAGDQVSLYAATQADFIVDKSGASARIMKVDGNWRVIPYGA